MVKEFDLTSRICQHLDRHLTFPLLEFLCEKEVCICILFIRHFAQMNVILWKMK